MGELWNKSVIAMKGHPFTKKTEFAKLIAVSLKCPLLSLDDILDAFGPDNFHPSYSSVTRFQDVAFGAMIQIAKSNFSAGIIRHVVIDSPLSSRSQLDHLIQLAKSLELPRLVIVECKPDNIYTWKINFEEYLDCNPDEMKKWYKPKNWNDVDKQIQDGGYDERLDILINGLKFSKLVLDPVSDHVGSSILSPRTPPFLDAVKYMINRDENGPDIVVYRRRRQGQYHDNLYESNSSVRFWEEGSDGQSGLFHFGKAEAWKKTRSCRSGDYITNFYAQEQEHQGQCMACDKPITGAATYTCKYCIFALHKECADHELPNQSHFPQPESYIRYRPNPYLKDLEHVPCRSCWKSPFFNSSCGDCLFKTHLKNRRIPTVIRHDCNEHFLSIVFYFLNPHEEFYQCRACGDPVNTLWYSCKICCVAYHYKCLVLIPNLVEHEHGGHHHHMALQYSSEEAEDYLCHLFFDNRKPEGRDPSRWFYSCQECTEHHSHLECVYHSSSKRYSDLSCADQNMEWKKTYQTTRRSIPINCGFCGRGRKKVKSFSRPSSQNSRHIGFDVSRPF